jgi:hypothetical protein
MQNTKYTNEQTQYILSIIRSGGPVVWSWGPEGFKATTYKGMAALRFSVNGFIHKGNVVAALNGGSDMFEVYCLACNGEVTGSQKEVCLDELIEVIDRLVEKGDSEEEYEDKHREWLAENPL